MNAIEYREELSGFFPGERNAVSYNTRNYTEDNHMTHMCHIISVECITQGICNALNLGLTGNTEDCCHYIVGMVASVWGIDFESCMCIIGDQGSIMFYGRIVNNIMSLLREENYPEVAFEASNLVLNLSTVPDNLRPGNANWNMSVQGAFDPVDQRCEDGYMVVDDGADGIRLTNLLQYTCGHMDGVPYTNDALYFYTCTNAGKKYVYSSNLPSEIFATVSNVSICKDKIGYMYDDEIVEIPMQ